MVWVSVRERRPRKRRVDDEARSEPRSEAQRLGRRRLPGSSIWPLGLLVAAAACGDGGGSVPVCDAAELADRLGAAVPGDKVTIGACTVTAHVTVPDAVTLAGVDAARSTLEGTTGDPVIRAEGGATIRSLRVSSRGEVGIELTGPSGALSLIDVVVHATRGTAIRVTDAGAFNAQNVTIEGPVTTDNAEAAGPDPDPAETAVRGIELVRVGASAPARIEGGIVRGFAGFGVLVEGSTVEIEDTELRSNLGVGLMARGGTVTLRDVRIEGTLRGVMPFSYGLVFAAGANVVTSGLELVSNEGVGLLHDEASGRHDAVVGMSNREPAIFIQRSTDVSVSGALTANRFAGLVSIASSGISLRDLTIESTARAVSLVPGTVRQIDVGDGAHVVIEAADDATFDHVVFRDNERAGLLVEVASAMLSSAAFSDVVVEASGAAYGAVAQSGDETLPLSAWGGTIERRGAALTNDPMFAEPLDVVGAIGPMYLPR